jgi:LysR family transcriptional regulator, hydrogen peroxide-inducible genes activator
MSEGHCFREQVLQLCSGAERTVCAEGGGSVRFESGSFETLMGLVDSGFGITVLPELLIRELDPVRRRRHVRPFAPPVPTREVSFIHSRDHLRRAIADALVECARSALPADLVAAADRRRGVVVPPIAPH